MTRKKLHKLTKEWAADRGILTNGKIPTQALKLASEFGELNRSLHYEIKPKDDIGDMLVVMTILADLDGYSLLDIWADAEKLDCVPSMNLFMDAIGRLCDASIKGVSIKDNLMEVLYYTVHISLDLQLDINKCWEIAYNDIKDRKGFLNKDGNFIKDTDEVYEQAKSKE